jgi:hypothetical protein
MTTKAVKPTKPSRTVKDKHDRKAGANEKRVEDKGGNTAGGRQSHPSAMKPPKT